MKKTKNSKKDVAKKSGSAKVAPSVSSNASHSKIIPLGNRVLIRPFTKEELEKKNSFGIILPGVDSREKSEQGIVLAVGPGEYHDGKLVAVNVHVGDKVCFSKYGFEDIKVDGEEFFLIKEENVLAILK